MDFKKKKPAWPEPGAPAGEGAAFPPESSPVTDAKRSMSVGPVPDKLDSPPPEFGPVPSQTDEPKRTGLPAQMLARSRHMLNLYGGLLIGFLVFYALADYTAYTTAEQRPGQLVFSNTMSQLWTACFRMAFVLGASLSLLRLFWPELFRFFRSDSASDPDMTNTIQYELTSFQRLCVFLLAFFGLCYLFIMLLSVNLPETISVGR